jgi:hypothetical protein
VDSILGWGLFDVVQGQRWKRQGLLFEPEAELLAEGVLQGDSGDRLCGSIAGLLGRVGGSSGVWSRSLRVVV